MATWMLYVTAVAGVLAAAGFLAERGLLPLGRSTRWAWLLVTMVSLGWPVTSGPLIGTRPGIGPDGGASKVLYGASGPTLQARAAGADVVFGVPDLLLLGAWGTASLVLLAVLVLSAVSLTTDRRRWQTRMVAGEDVFLSAFVGPAVVGAVRPRIVMPGWVLDLDEGLQELIVAHERQHIRAGDSRLLAFGLFALVLLPWCVPLWWQFHRLRLAIETDCDRRLLQAGVPPRDYAHALLSVARRHHRGVVPLAGMALSRITLERRIRLLAAGPPDRRWHRAFALLAAAVLVGGGAAFIPGVRPPSLTALTISHRSPASAPSGPEDLGVAAMSRSSKPAAEGPSETSRAEAGLSPRGGSLPGDPGREHVAAAIETHHSDAIGSGLQKGSVIWFIADEHGDVVRTGVTDEGEQQVIEQIRSRYPSETSELALTWKDVPVGEGEASVVWLLPGAS